jgi:hypothetical protein
MRRPSLFLNTCDRRFLCAWIVVERIDLIDPFQTVTFSTKLTGFCGFWVLFLLFLTLSNRNLRQVKQTSVTLWQRTLPI